MNNKAHKETAKSGRNGPVIKNKGNNEVKKLGIIIKMKLYFFE
jgi:hypothetical protein